MTPNDHDIVKALNQGISAELAAYIFYLKASRKPETSAFKTVLEELALEEKKHFHILEREHHSQVRSEQWISIADILKEERLPEINEEMTGRHRELIDNVEKADSVATILDLAYALEKEARDSFTRQAEATSSPEGEKMFSRLARFEEGHMRKIDQLRKTYSS